MKEVRGSELGDGAFKVLAVFVVEEAVLRTLREHLRNMSGN